MLLQLEKLHFNSPQIAEKGPNGRKQLYKIQLPGQETAFSAKRTGYFPFDAFDAHLNAHAAGAVPADDEPAPNGACRPLRCKGKMAHDLRNLCL